MSSNNDNENIYLIDLKNKSSGIIASNFEFGSSNNFVKIGKYYRHPKYIDEILNNVDDDKYMIMSGYTGKYECEIQIGMTGKCFKDENVFNCLKREIMEEMGLDLINNTDLIKYKKLKNKINEETQFYILNVTENTFEVKKKFSKYKKLEDDRLKRVACLINTDLNIGLKYLEGIKLPNQYSEAITYIGLIRIGLVKKLLKQYIKKNPTNKRIY